MPTALAILPLDIAEFQSVIQHHGVEKAMAYVQLQIHYLQHGPILNQAEVVAAASIPPRIDTQSSMDAWRIDTQTNMLRHLRLDEYRDKCKKMKEKMTELARKKWSEAKANHTHASRIDTRSMDATRIDTQKKLDKDDDDAKRMKRQEHARHAITCRWARHRSEIQAKNTHATRIAVGNFAGTPSNTSLTVVNTSNKQEGYTSLLGMLLHRSVPDAVPVRPAQPSGALSGGREDAEAHHGVGKRLAAARTVRNGHRNAKPDPANPPGKSDPRYEPCKNEVRQSWPEFHTEGTPFPWSNDDTKALGRLLLDHSGLTVGIFKHCLNNWIASEVNHSQHAWRWLPHLLEYSSCPLDRYGKPRKFDKQDQWQMQQAQFMGK